MIEYSTDIFSFVKSEENNFILPVSISDDWEWGMKDFIKQCFFYKNGRFLTGNNDEKPFKNIVLYLRNLQDWAEDIDVKDIAIYANDKNKQHLSFLIKKYHDEIFIKENDLDTFIDEGRETKNDYGGVLVKNLNQVRPEAIDWQSVAFCDQTDIMSGPIAIKHFYSPDELKDMAEFGWGEEKNGATISLDDLILLSQNWKVKDPTSKQAKTPGKYIEIFEVHGVFPESWLKDNGSDEKYVRQFHIIGYYNDDSGKQTGVTLFKRKEKLEDVLDFFQGEKIYGRGLGRSRIEELFEDQVWTNYSMKRKMDMLDAASKTILKTTDLTLAAKHPSGLKDLNNLELLELEDGKDVNQLDTFPRNAQLFTQAMQELEEHAKTTSGATNPLLGVEPSSGTPFRSLVTQINQGQGLHAARRERYARFIERIYRNWIIPHIAKELVKGTEFLSTLDNDELEFVLERVSDNQAKKQQLEMVLNLELPTDFETLKQQIKEDWMKRGNVLPLEILKDELKGVELKVEINVAGAQKDLAAIVDKISNLLIRIIANPQGFMQAMQIPAFARPFSKIVEYSGLSQSDFSLPAGRSQLQQPQQPPQKEIQQMVGQTMV